jgi:hypothetical protein
MASTPAPLAAPGDPSSLESGFDQGTAAALIEAYEAVCCELDLKDGRYDAATELVASTVMEYGWRVTDCRQSIGCPASQIKCRLQSSRRVRAPKQRGFLRRYLVGPLFTPIADSKYGKKSDGAAYEQQPDAASASVTETLRVRSPATRQIDAADAASLRRRRPYIGLTSIIAGTRPPLREACQLRSAEFGRD